MKKVFKSEFTEAELRKLIREEVSAALSDTPGNERESFIDISQAAEFTKLKTGTIYNLVNDNKIPFHKSGKRVLFKRSELETWVRSEEKKPGGPNK